MSRASIFHFTASAAADSVGILVHRQKLEGKKKKERNVTVRVSNEIGIGTGIEIGLGFGLRIG